MGECGERVELERGESGERVERKEKKERVISWPYRV